MDIFNIAKICHEANKSFCATIGDFSQVSWEDAPQWQRDSVIAGVRHVVANPLVEPRESHEEWLKCKKAAGWQYGPVKDEAKKEHPCMKPFEDLPEEQQLKDVLFISIVKALYLANF